MTPKQKAAIKHVIKVKHTSGQLTATEYADLVIALENLAMVGTSYHDANIALGLTKGAKAAATQAAPAAPLGSATASVLDPGTLATQQATDKLEKQLAKVYLKAKKELKAKLAQFTAAFQIKDAGMQAKLATGQISQAQYDSWKAGQVFQSAIWKQKVDQVTGTLANANEEALQIINGEKMGVFAENANYLSYQIDQDANLDISFAIYDQDAVGNLLQNQPELMPRKIINGKKDKAWNQHKIANCVAQGIIQGESLPKLAARIADSTASDNNKAMMRYAHTALTAAQNAGRMHTMQRALDMGIKCKKCWLATLDGRTRDSHQALDGQTKPVNEPFISPLGKIMYPGDPNAESQADVWNCRCTLTYEYEGFPNDPEFDQRRDNESGEIIQNMDYREWKAAKKGSVLNDLNTAKVDLAKAQKDYIAGKVDENHVYHNIWKDDVTLADYPAKKGSIQAKRDYYKAEIDKIKAAQANGESWATDEKLKEKKKLLSELNKFEKHGKLYEARQEALKKVQDIYAQIGYGQAAQAPQTATPGKAPKKPKKAPAASGGVNSQPAAQTGAGTQPAAKKGRFAPDAWDEKTKRAAKLHDRRAEVDKILRPELDAIWPNLTEEEKFATWLYTWNSHPMNQPLSGYNDGWSRSYYAGGPDKTNWGHQDNYSNRNLSSYKTMRKFCDSRGQPSYKKAITDLTKAIEKSEIKKGIWFKRQSDENGLAGIMEATGFDFNKIRGLLDGQHSQQELEAAFVGQMGKMNSFTSCGMAKDANWFGNVYWKVYVPEGTKGLYSEPQSHYGNSMGGRDELYKPGSSYSGIGTEAEVILQRGTEYRITGIRQKGYGSSVEYEVEMEVVAQPDYFVYGDEDTYNDGKTRHKK